MNPSPTLGLRFRLRTLLLIVTATSLVAAIVKQATEIRSLTSANKSLVVENEGLRRSADIAQIDNATEVLSAAGAALATRERVVIDEKWRGNPGLFARIADVHDLTFLGLTRSPVTDEELKVIVGLPRLRILRLNDTQVDDGCIGSIIAAKSLNYLAVWDTRITKDGIRRIHEALPSLHIQSRRVLVAISPSTASAGLGCQVVYTVTLTNAGSDPDTFQVDITDNFSLPVHTGPDQFEPATSRSSWQPHTLAVAYPRGPVLVAPGASNAQKVTVTATPPPTVEPKAYSLTVWAHSTTDSDVLSEQTSATLAVLPLGVIVSLSPLPGPGVKFRPDVVPNAPPGTTFEARITNTGKSTDTFDLSLAGLGAALGALDSKLVTLAAGASQTVKVTTRAVKFADGNLPLTLVAASQTNAAVRAQTSWTLVMGAGGRELKASELESFLIKESP
jgi:hypothetical protein